MFPEYFLTQCTVKVPLLVLMCDCVCVQVCDCIGDSAGGGRVMCQQCFLPNLDLAMQRWNEYGRNYVQNILHT